MSTYTLQNTEPTIHAETQKYLDENFAKETGLPTLVLMEQAAMAISRLIMKLDRKREKSILFLAGKGNNGGDAFTSARQLLAKGYRVQVLEIFQDSKTIGDAAKNKAAYQALAGEILSTNDLLNFDLSPYDLIVDGIMGTGFTLKRPLSENVSHFIHRINLLKGQIKVAIDIPTGIETYSGACDKEVLKADYTVTFSALKTAMYADPATIYCGKIILADIGMPKAWLEKKIVEFQKNRPYLPRVLTRKTFQNSEIEKNLLSHKGKAGKTLIVGGEEGMSGAMHLALRAAHSTGTGYVYGRLPQSLICDTLNNSPQSLIDVFPTSKEVWCDLIQKVDSVAVGPGAGKAKWLDNSLELLFEQAKYLIIDADGLNYLAKIKDWQIRTKNRVKSGLAPVVLTPHVGEFKRLAPDLVDLLNSNRQAAASQLAKSCGCLVILKGHRTVIASPNGEIYLNSSGNQGLAKAGSGDVLTGFLAGFAAQKQNILEASALAVYFHGMLADLAKEKTGIRAMRATDLFLFTREAYRLLHWQD